MQFGAGCPHVKWPVGWANSFGDPGTRTNRPHRAEAELWYQPIGCRWANNLKPYNAAAELRRFTGFFDSMAQSLGTAAGLGIGDSLTVP